MKDKDITSILAGLCIVVAFFLGYAYALRQLQIKQDIQKNSPIYIDISTSTKNITIDQAPKNVFFRVNGTLFQSGSINLKK